MNYWWVNNNTSFELQINGGYLWAPKCAVNGRRLHAYDNMTSLKEGDIIFMFAQQKIIALGLVLTKAVTASRPEDRPKDWISNDEGWQTKVKYIHLNSTTLTRLKDWLKQDNKTTQNFIAALPEKYSPIQKIGNANQSTFLAEISPEMLPGIKNYIGEQWADITSKLQILK